MKFFQAYLHAILFSLLLTSTPPAIAKYTKTGCNDTCGNDVTIPFPFGIGEARCYVNPWYRVECKSSKPYLPKLNNLEVLRVDLGNPTVTVSTPKITDCRKRVLNNSDILGMDLVESPFLFSKLSNKFVNEGCGTATMIANNASELTGCSSACDNVTPSDRRNCFGVGCCQTPVPHRVKSYIINLTRLEEEDGGCGYASLVDRNLYDQGKFSIRNSSFIPISLVWTLTDADQITCCEEKNPERRIVALFNGTPVNTRICGRQSQEDDPYLIDGCNKPTEACRWCRDHGGSCLNFTILDVDDSVFSQNYTCSNPKWKARETTPLGVILGVSISTSVFFIFAFSYVSFKLIKKTKERRQKRRFSKRNGDLLQKQQEATDPSLVDKTKLFTYRELQKATNNFNENRILGQGAQGTVYKGMLMNGRIVAVKKSKMVDESQLEQFINEVVILSQVNHRNVVKLLGCCLETNVPLLVSEFIPNGTLYDRLHNRTEEFPISFNMRLQIATEVAGAIAYLHSETSVRIYHRDIKTNNILLDDKYRAKVSDFGTSRFALVEQTHLTTLVKGTFGYLDPEYFQSNQFTEKSDVYSFGVVLVELLTGERPISDTRFGENGSLIAHFMSAMEEGRVMTILDAVVIKEGAVDELMAAANLAMRCLNLKGKCRPTMKELATELEIIRTSHIPSRIQMYTNSMMYGEELSMLTYGESSSTFLGFTDSISQ